MRTKTLLLLLAVFPAILVLLLALFLRGGESATQTSATPEEITATMYVLKQNGGIDWTQEITLCQTADTRYGCTAFDRDHYPPDQVVPYPYATNPATVSIEDDYLLDVVAREMGTYYHPLALRAQAVVARTYAYCAMRANEGTEDFWGNCRKEINNSNEFQVFVPWYFESIDSPQVIQDAVNETRGLYLIYAPEPGKGPIFSEFSADAYLRTVQGDYPYLRSVENPISSGCDANNAGHGHGMSQEGASRWARGNQCSYAAQGDMPWPVHWEDYRQILVHYYTGVHLQDRDGNLYTPDDRWNLLNHTVPPTATADALFTSSLMVQNTSTYTWPAGMVALMYQWTAPGGNPDPNEWHIADWLPALEMGESMTVEIPIQAPPSGGQYLLHIDACKGIPAPQIRPLQEEEEFCFHERGWPHAVITVTVVGAPTPTPTPTPSPTPIPTPTPTPGWGWWIAAEEAALQERTPREREAYSRLLSRVRDEVIAPDPKGETYIRLTYRYAPEVTALLLEDRALRQEVAKLMEEVRPLLEELVERRDRGKIRLERGWVERAMKVLEKVEGRASPELQSEIQWWKRWLPRFAGKTGWEIWQMLPERRIRPEEGGVALPEEAVLRGLSPLEVAEYGRLLSRVRDEVMLAEPGGEVYVALVYRYTPEVVRILLQDEKLRGEAELLLIEAKPGLESLVSGKGGWRFSRDWVKRAERLLGMLKERGSMELKAELSWWQERVRRWEGKTPQEVWEELLQEGRVRGR